MDNNDQEKDALEVVDDYLQEVNDNTEERLVRIKTLLDFLNYQLRLTELSDEEKKDYYHTLEGYPLSDSQRKVLDNCKSEKQKDGYIDMWARSTYFRRCAWQKYLFGSDDKKPTL